MVTFHVLAVTVATLNEIVLKKLGVLLGSEDGLDLGKTLLTAVTLLFVTLHLAVLTERLELALLLVGEVETLESVAAGCSSATGTGSA